MDFHRKIAQFLVDVLLDLEHGPNSIEHQRKGWAFFL